MKEEKLLFPASEISGIGPGGTWSHSGIPNKLDWVQRSVSPKVTNCLVRREGPSLSLGANDRVCKRSFKREPYSLQYVLK